MTFKDSIVLYKTPLDSEYRNVYDDYTTVAQYNAFLNAAFTGYKTISLPNPIVSRKNVGDLFELVVNGYDSMDLHDYNYMKFTTANNEVKFAFILSVDSDNDNQTVDSETGLKLGASCLLHCKLDLWTNHYLEIKNSFNSIEESRCTIDAVDLRNYPSKIKTYTFNEKVEYEGLLPVGITEMIGDYNIIVPIWLRVLISENGMLTNARGSYIIKNEIDYNGYNTVYYPLGLVAFTRDGVKILNLPCQYIFYDAREDRQESFIQGGFHIFNIKSSAVISSTITVNVPFLYDLSYTMGEFDLVIPSTFGFCWGTKLETQNGLLISDETSGGYTALSLDYAEASVEKFTQINPSPLLNYSTANRYSTSFVGRNEQILNEYPFNYRSISANGVDIPVIGAVGEVSQLYLRYDCNKKIYAFIELQDINDKTILIPLTNPDEMPVQEVELSEYLQRNTGALINQGVQALFSTARQITSSATGMVADFMTGNVGGFVKEGANLSTAPMQIASTAVSIGMNIYDKYKTPATVRQGGGNAFETPIPKDCCIIKKHTAYYPDKMIEDYHNNGYECFYVGSIFEKRRDVFDIDTGNLTLTAKISDEDKTQLIQMFSAGVCRWHLDGLVTNSTRRTILANMNRAVFNYPMSLFPLQ